MNLCKISTMMPYDYNLKTPFIQLTIFKIHKKKFVAAL